MKLFTKLALTASSLTLGFAILNGSSASAAIINYAFTVDSPITKGKGLFSFDDSTFSNNAIPVALVKSLSFQFDNDSNLYTEKDDTEYPNYPLVFPTLSLINQTPIGLQYSFYDKANPSIYYEINGYNTNNEQKFAISSPNNQIIFGNVSYSRVPEPSLLGGTLMACSIGYFMKRKVTLAKKVKA